MEINITALGRTLKRPFIWLRQRLNVAEGIRRYRRLTPAQRRLLWLRWLRTAAIIGMVGMVTGVILFVALFVYYSSQLPKPGQIVRREGFSTRIYDRNGELLYDLFDSERRTPVAIDQVPESVKQATIAVEDKDFYNHRGFDALTILRIPYNLVTRQRIVGGSTLTQQLVKNVFLTNEFSVIRKFKEFVLSLQIERTFTKDQILEMYLNEVPYGGTAWGIGTASEIYFDKHVSELTPTEAAILAGLPQRPSSYSPYSGKTDADGQPLWKFRTKGVLRRMHEDGYLTDLAYEQSLAELDTVTFQSSARQIKAPHFVFYVRDQLVEQYGEDLTERGGLQVTTTLDLSLQQTAETVVAEEIEKVASVNITNGAAVVMNPQNGEILSMVGSKDYFSKEIDGQFNVAVDGLRQPGSSIKPVTYLAMFRKGYTPGSVVADVDTVFAESEHVQKYQPKNYDGQFHGLVTLRNSLGSSLNIPAVKSVAIVGVDAFLQTATDLGFTTLEPTPANLKRFGLAVTLGGAEVHLIDTVTAYSTFANGGNRVEPVSILKIEDKGGKRLFEHREVAGKQVISPEEAFLVNHVLSDNNARLMAFGANSQLNVGKGVAVKTGTTNDQRDNWTIGWSQDIMVGTWVGNNDNSPMQRVASGITGASPIWRRVLDFALKNGYSAPEWQPPAGIEQVELDVVSGYPAHDEFSARTEYAIKGTAPALPDPIHTKLKLCRGEHKLATDARIGTGDYEEKEFLILKENDPVSKDGVNRWQQGIDAWVAGQTDERYRPPTEYCGEQSEISIRFEEPQHERTYAETKIPIRVTADAGDGIEKMEIWVNGGVRETIQGRSYAGELDLGSGRYEIYVKVRSRSGQEKDSQKVKIGTGGQDWREPTPTPVPSTPSPTPTPTAPPASPTPTSSASPSPSPSPTATPDP